MLPDPYLECRYHPFHNAMGLSSGLPDGRGQLLLNRDWKSVYDFVATTTGFQIRISPVFPNNVRVYSTGGLTVGATTLHSAPLSDTSGVILDPGAMGTGSPGYGTLTHTMGTCSSARLLTVGYRLFYTGAASTAAGLIIADNLGFKIDDTGMTNTAAISYINGASGAAILTANTVPFVTVDSPVFTSSGYVTKKQAVVRPEHGIQGILPLLESSRSRRFRSWWEVGKVICQDKATTTAGWATVGNNNVANTLPQPVAVVIDDALGEVNLTITNAGSYRLEVITCMEQDLEGNSTLIDLAHKSSTWNEQVLQIDDTLNSVVGPTPLDEPLVPSMARPQRVRRAKAANRKARPPQPPKPSGAKRRRARKNAKRRAHADGISVAIQGLKIE